jgi:FkbM family methyltransferase
LRLREDEVFVDCGAFDGDTLRQYLSVTDGVFSHVVALEPDPVNFARLQEFVRSSSDADRISLFNAAVTADGGSLQFAASGNVAAHATRKGEESVGGVISVPGVRLDDLSHLPTFVKMDIEGSEMSAIESGKMLLRNGRTVWAVTLYHHLEDFWRIPLYFHSVAPQMSFFLRHYAEDYAETIFYAVPADRLLVDKEA